MKRRAFITHRSSSQERHITRDQYSTNPVEVGVEVTPYSGASTVEIMLTVYNNGTYEVSRDDVIEHFGAVS
ncbi:MAG TPA: hypothetical protein VIK05_13460 [Ilumatobacteraceae bacterium]|jgi:hypothetical protein